MGLGKGEGGSRLVETILFGSRYRTKAPHGPRAGSPLGYRNQNVSGYIFVLLRVQFRSSFSKCGRPPRSGARQDRSRCQKSTVEAEAPRSSEGLSTLTASSVPTAIGLKGPLKSITTTGSMSLLAHRIRSKRSGDKLRSRYGDFCAFLRGLCAGAASANRTNWSPVQIR